MTEKNTDGSQKVLELFEDGRKFTVDLLKENERLRALNAQLRNEKRDLENQFVKVDVPSLQRKVSLVEEENQRLRLETKELRDQFSSIEEENREFADRYVQVDRQNADLVNLYVASHRLHSTLVYDDVIQSIKEIVINMIGSELFGIYALDEKEEKLVLIGGEGLDESRSLEVITIGQGVLGRHAQSGETYVTPDKGASHESQADPIACIPLRVGDRVLGVIGIYQLLNQKESLRDIDQELFELLGERAASAIYVSKLHAASERRRAAGEAFGHLLKEV